MFAAVTLGGLGTTYGAMVGSIIIGVLDLRQRRCGIRRVDDPLIPSEMKNVGALVVMILLLMIRPQGLFGRQGTDRLTCCGGKSSPTRSAPGSARRSSSTALAAIGLNLHFGYTGLLNFGQVGFMAAGAYGVGITCGTYRPSRCGSGVLVGLAAGVVLALLLGRADAAPPRRLPRHRHHRRRRDHPPDRAVAASSRRRSADRAGINDVADDFQDSWNFLFDP